MIRSFSAVALASYLAACAVAEDSHISVPLAASSYYTDTHDHYSHTNVVDLEKYSYFQKVNDRNAIVLTFDCAWVEQSNGMEILNALDRLEIKTTFFISGPLIFKNGKQGRSGGFKRENFAMIKKMVDDGHEFGNHSVTHPHNSPSINWTWELKELEAGWNEVIRLIYGDAPPQNAKMKPYWRAPYGEYDHRSLEAAAKIGYPNHFGWNVDTRDTTGLPSCEATTSRNCLDAGKMTDYVLRFGQKNKFEVPGVVVLAHLSNPYRWAASKLGLDRLVTEYRQHGYDFVRLSETYVGRDKATADPTDSDSEEGRR